MNNYKITNKKSKRDYFLNEEEMANFFIKNCYQSKTGAIRYDIVNLTKQKRIKRNKILNTIALVCFFAATILSTILIIECKY